MDSPKTVDEALALLKQQLQEKVGARKDLIDRLVVAVKMYEVATQQDDLSLFLERNGFKADVEKKAPNAALDLLVLAENLPELAVLKEPTQVEEEEEEEEEEVQNNHKPNAEWSETEAVQVLSPTTSDPYAALRQINKPICLYGGQPVPNKLALLHRHLKMKVEWNATERGSQGAGEVISLSHQVRNGKYSAIILLNELLSHTESDTLIRAAKISGTPHAIARKGGIGALKAALDKIEEQVRRNAHG